MNVRKRGLALLMCICMIFTLLPFSALADATAQDDGIVYGKYSGTTWTPQEGLTAENDPYTNSATGADVEYSKTAEPVENEPNTYNVTLTIKSKTSETPPGASAVVLVIDNSGSMGDHQRLAKAKAAAKKFVDDYGKSGSGRYIALVSFADLANKYNFGDGWTWDNWFPESVYWLDASNENNRGAINASIQKMRADGGTNLEQGLSTANDLFKDNAISKISRSNNKYVIALTDGKPTFSGIYLDILGNSPKLGNGFDCTEQICNATETTATTLKGNVNTLYTVCYGAENEGTYTGGLTVGEFLKQKIASPGEAYNATDSSDSLSKAFAKIYKSIEQGISSGFTVTDPMGQYVNLDSASLTGNGASVNNGTIKWEPKNGTTETNTDGSKTTTYTLTYKVTLGEVPKDDTYPLNEDTTLKFMDGDTEKTLQFNVPGVYREAPKYTVTYKPGDHGTLTDADNDGNVVYSNLKNGDPTPTAPTVNADEGYYFTGWDKEIAATVTADAVYTAQYAEKIAVTFTGESGKKVYTGSEQKLNRITVTGLPEGYTYKDLTYSASGTNVGSYDGVFSGNVVIRDAEKKDVTQNFTITKTPGSLEITPITDEVTVKITGNTKTVTYNGTEQSVTGYTTDVVDISITVSLKDDKGAEAKGMDAGKYMMGLTAEDFNVTSENYSNIKVVVVDGYLDITPIMDEITVTITGNHDSKVYNGKEQSVTGYTTDVGDKNITVALKDIDKAIAKGTNVGTYYMGLTKDDFTVTSDNYSNIKVVVVDGYLDITPITDKVTVKITGNTKTVTYNGTEQSVTGYTTDVGTKPITVTLKEGSKAEAKGTDVHRYMMGLTEEDFNVTSENYSNIKVVVVDGYLDITPITDEVTVKITGNTRTVTYNGDEQSVTGYTTDVGTKPITVTLKEGSKAEAKGTDVHKYMMGLTEEDFNVTSENYSNIKVVVVDGYLDITPITDEVTIKITGNTKTVTYNGTEQSVTGYTTDVGTKPITVTLKEGSKSEAKGTDVHKYMMGLTEEDFNVTSKNYSNIKVVVVDGYLDITPITDEVTVKIAGNTKTVTYNGTEQSVTGYTTDVGTKPITVTLKEGSKAEAKGTDVHKYMMGLTEEDFNVTSENYSNIKVVVVDGYLDITPITDEVTVKITGNTKTVTYNGKEQKVEGYDYTVTEGIDKSQITVALIEGKTAEAKGINPDTYYMDLSKETFTVTSKNYGNIAVIVEDGWLKINRRPMPPVNPGIGDEIIVEITGSSDSVVYDGTEHSVKGYTVKISDPRYTEADFTFTGKAEASGVNAGSYEMGLKAEQFKNTNARFTNVKFVIKADGVLTITPKELTITAGSKTEYGPTPVTCNEWTVSGLVAGDKVESVKITGIQSVPGSSPNVPSDAVIKNAKGEDVTKNYAIKYVNGTLTMLEVLNKEDHFNYIIGTPEGLSLPTANVTRAEVATIFFRLMTDDARAKFDSLDNNFSDVAKGKWYNRAISTLANAGIIKGDPAGTYRPGDPITRAEMAAIIARFGDFKEGGKTFSDISGHWAQKYIELAASNGWINGNPDGTFKPNNNITRAETVAMINRVLDRQTGSNDDLLPVAQMTNWSDNMDTAKWYYRDMQEATNNHKAERVGNSIYEKWTEKLPDIDWASYQI